MVHAGCAAAAGGVPDWDVFARKPPGTSQLKKGPDSIVLAILRDAVHYQRTSVPLVKALPLSYLKPLDVRSRKKLD